MSGWLGFITAGKFTLGFVCEEQECQGMLHPIKLTLVSVWRTVMSDCVTPCQIHPVFCSKNCDARFCYTLSNWSWVLYEEEVMSGCLTPCQIDPGFYYTLSSSPWILPGEQWCHVVLQSVILTLRFCTKNRLVTWFYMPMADYDVRWLLQNFQMGFA